MTIECFTLIIISTASIASIIYIPKKQIRKALLCFISSQAINWFIVILLAYNHWATFPVREFPKATKVAFIPQFLFYPMVFTWFVLLYPKDKSLIIKILHYIIFISIFIWFVYFISIYTNLRKYTNGFSSFKLLTEYANIFIHFRLSHIYINWFFKDKLSPRGE